LLTALIIKATSNGPLLFRQERIGLLGRKFTLLKFRTMNPGSDTAVHEAHVARLMASNEPMTKLDSRGDARLIPFGRLLRAAGLDELPQLINVLRGEMSLVGPRPCLPAEYDRHLPWQKYRFQTLPGLTGLWQVSGKNRTTFSEMIDLDLQYVRKRTLWLDLKIILKTIPLVLAEAKNNGPSLPALDTAAWRQVLAYLAMRRRRALAMDWLGRLINSRLGRVTEHAKGRAWIGVDLDGTLAEYHGRISIDHIGAPVPAMVERVKAWLEEGIEVRIFTARVSHPTRRREAARVIGDWCERQGLPRLRTTNAKDFDMIELWDDRAVRVETNSGKPADDSYRRAGRYGGKRGRGRDTDCSFPAPKIAARAGGAPVHPTAPSCSQDASPQRM
jgi:lipopolysaccharide/colanic/teichoic acid biosynthesis glycosyltransferase